MIDFLTLLIAAVLCLSSYGIYIAIRKMLTAIRMRRVFTFKRPLNVFHGRVFPHTEDDGWEVVDGRYNVEDVRLKGITIARRDGMLTLLVNGVPIQTGERVDAYYGAVMEAVRRRAATKALEEFDRGEAT